MARGLRGRVPAARFPVRPAHRAGGRSTGEAAGAHARGVRPGRPPVPEGVRGGAEPVARSQRRKRQMRSVTVVGGSLAGLSAARALRTAGFDGRVTVVGEERHRPYDRPPLSKELLSGRMAPSDLALEAEDEDLAVDWRLGERGAALHTADRGVELADGTLLRADGLVIATGARARSLPGTEDVAGVHTLRTLDDALALAAELRPGRRLVVIGAGFIGAEVASTAHQLGLSVTVLEAQEVPLAGPLGEPMGRVVAGLHEANGVRLLCGVGVHAVHASVGAGGVRRVDRVELVDGRVLPADVVVVGVGAQPNVEWLADSGVD